MSDSDEEPLREQLDGPLREPLMPRVSIQSIIVLTAVSAVLMVIAQQGLMHGKMWAMAITIAVVLGAILFCLYAIAFIWANPLSLLSSSMTGPEPEETQQHSPTLRMPDEWVPPDASSQHDTDESKDG